MTFKGPNKTYLAKLRSDRKEIRSYLNLLEERRELLLREIRKRVERHPEIERKVNEKYTECRESYLRSWDDVGNALYKILDCCQEKVEAEFTSLQVSGVIIRTLEPRARKAGSYPLTLTTWNFDSLRKNSSELLDMCFELGIEKKIISKLEEELSKTTRKSNFLKNILLRETEQNIKEVKLAIEERGRQDLARMRLWMG